MYCASLCRSAIHAPRICNNIGQRFGLRRHRIFVPVTSPRSCNRCRIAGGTCREYTVQSVPARSRCSGIGSGHTSSISTPTPPALILCRRQQICFSFRKCTRLVSANTASHRPICLPVSIGIGYAENTDRCQPPKRQSQRRTKPHRFPFLFQTKQSECGCSVLP